MRTVMYHRDCVEGKVFDTERDKEDPLCPTGGGWVHSPADLLMTTDQVVESFVKAELARQVRERPELEAEYQKKFGRAPHGRAKDETLIKALDS